MRHSTAAAPDPLTLTFAALADPTRRAILARLRSGEASVMELAAPFALSQPTISKHIKVLQEAGLVVPHPRFRERGFVLRPLAEVAPDWVDPVTGRTVGELVSAVS